MLLKPMPGAAAEPRPRPAMSPEPGGPLLRVNDLRVEYLTGGGAVKAVDGVSFDIAQGEVLGLAGESGSGKSTIAHALMRLLHPPAVIAGGEITFQDVDVLALSQRDLEDFRWSKISMVFQSAMNSLNPVMTIGDQITDAIRAHKNISKVGAYERAAELLEAVGIEPQRLRSYPHQLSGGMRQRAVIAIALALEPPMMIMDEPTTALDVVMQREIMQQIEELKTRLGFSILFITHDLSLLVEFSDRIAVRYAGEIVELGPAKEIFANPLHPYTRGLMNSFPALEGEKVRLMGIPGSPPNMVQPPSGCRFHPRCAQFKPMHAEVRPKLVEVRPDHFVACHLYTEGGAA
jgi:peptide/nickel transport system ATP-binding protein